MINRVVSERSIDTRVATEPSVGSDVNHKDLRNHLSLKELIARNPKREFRIKSNMSSGALSYRINASQTGASEFFSPEK